MTSIRTLVVTVARIVIMATLLLPGSCQIWEEFSHLSPPTVRSHQPDRAIISELPQISIAFSAAMARINTENAFSLTSDGSSIAGRFHWSDGNRRLRFVPDRPLASGTSYLMQVGTQAEDRWGNSLSQQFQFRFSLGASEQTFTLIDITPQSGAQLTAPRQSIRLHFSEALNRQSFYANFSIEPTIAGRFRWSASDRTVLYEPLEDWQPQENYRLQLVDALRSADNRLLERRFTSTFSVPAEISPTLTGITLLASDGDNERSMSLAPEADMSPIVIEKNDNIRFSFSIPIADSDQSTLLSVVPSFPRRLHWDNQHQHLLIVPLVPLTWQEQYRFSLLEQEILLHVAGVGSKPPQIEELFYIPDRSAPNTRYLLEQGANIDFQEGNSGALLIVLALTDGADIDRATVGESLTIASAGAIFSFTIERIVIGASHEGLQEIEMAVAIARNGNPPDVVSLQIDTQLADTLGNRLLERFRVEVNGL